MDFQTTNTVLPMLPASAGATAAKALVFFFCIILFVEFPSWGARKELREYSLHARAALTPIA
jgi:hypothetical protein